MPREFEDYAPVEEAIRLLASSCRVRPRVEFVDLGQAYGRMIARDVRAKRNVPPEDASHFDGYAVRASDITAAAGKGREASLLLKPGVPVGRTPRISIGPGEASKVATGGYLPSGADTVVPVEGTRLEGGRLLVSSPIERGAYVYRTGQDMKKGERLLAAGHVVRAQDLALLGLQGIGRVGVLAKPRVAILPTGSELTDDIRSGEMRKDGRVFESHSMVIGHLVEEAGGLPLRQRIVPDDKAAITRALRTALKGAEFALSLAGTSVGDPDLVESSINSLGSPGVLVHGVRVNRGRVMGFGVVGGKAIVMLPGPIQAALNAFILFGYPLIRSHLGRPLEPPPAIPARLGRPWEATGRFKSFDQIVYVQLRAEEREIVATPGSGETEKASFLVSKDGYLLVPGGKGRLNEGEPVSVHLIPGFSGGFEWLTRA